MFKNCGKSRRVWWMAALVCIAATASRAGDLTQDVTQFLSDYDRLAAERLAITADRAQMGANVNNATELRKSVKQFFLDRDEASATRVLKALDRKEMRVTLNFKGEKVAKPVKGSGDLTVDAGSYITNYDAWKTQQAMVQTDIDTMRQAVTAKDTAALTTATTSFFTNSRLRLQKRLQWQSDIRAMKKDVSFKGTGKALKPTSTTLGEVVTEFLSDRAAWDAKNIQLNADRDGIRSALSGSTALVDAVTKFLTTRRSTIVMGRELFLDREAMRMELRGKRAKERKLGAEVSTKDLDQDEEDGALEESADATGE